MAVYCACSGGCQGQPIAADLGVLTTDVPCALRRLRQDPGSRDEGGAHQRRVRQSRALRVARPGVAGASACRTWPTMPASSARQE